MEKERADSWSKFETKDINAIARKTVDYSTFTKGTTYQLDIMKDLSVTFQVK